MWGLPRDAIGIHSGMSQRIWPKRLALRDPPLILPSLVVVGWFLLRLTAYADRGRALTVDPLLARQTYQWR